MIAQNIDGTSAGGAGAIFDLLKVVASPEQYAAQITELQAKIDESNALIALAGKASEIVAMREGLATERADAQAEVAKLKAEAADMLDRARDDAAKLIADAKDDAADE